MDEKERILEALENGNYSVDIEPVNCIEEYTKYDRSNFYVFYDMDGPRSSTDLGRFTFTVTTDEEGEYEFVYDMNSGDWEGNDFCNDDEIVDALEALDEFIPYDDYDMDRQWEVYAKVFNIPIDSPYYWEEDNSRPTDIACYGDKEVQVPVLYFYSAGDAAHNKKVTFDCTLYDDDLYKLYTLGKRILDDADAKKVISFPGGMIKNTYTMMFTKIMSQIEYNFAKKVEEGDIVAFEMPQFTFMVQFSKELLDENL